MSSHLVMKSRVFKDLDMSLKFFGNKLLISEKVRCIFLKCGFHLFDSESPEVPT